MRKELIYLLDWIFKNADLILNITGTFLIAFSFGKNLERVHQFRKSLITRRTTKVYLASFVRPMWFRIGCVFLILGFIITSLTR